MKGIVAPFVLLAVVLTGGLLAYAVWRTSPVSSQEFLDSGKKFFAEKKYSEAVIQFLNVIQRDERNRDARFFLALSYYNQANLNAAAQQLAALLEYYPNDIAAKLRLANIYLAAGGTDPQFFRRASDVANEVLSKEPDNVAALVLSGNAAAGLQDYRTSVDLFEKAVSLDPRNTTAFVSLGRTQAILTNYAEAEKAFLNARKADPKDKNALVSLANYYRSGRVFDKAEALFMDALSMYPTDREIYVQVVGFYLEFGRIEKGEQVLKDAQSRDAKNPQPSLLLVDLYGLQNRKSDAHKLLLHLKAQFPQNLDIAARLALSFMPYAPDLAREEIDRILKGNSANPVGHLLLGQLQFLSGQYAEAEATFGKDQVVNSSYPEPHFFLGQIAMRKGQADQAQDHYEKSLAVNSGYLPAKVARAEVFINMGRRADARKEIRAILDVQPSFVPARLLKAALDRVERNDAQAEEELTALLKEQPDNAQVYRQMALYQNSRGRKADAEKSLVRALELEPDSHQALALLTQFYLLEKQTDRAIHAIERAAHTGREAFHRELIGLVNLRAGRPQDAEKAFRDALEKDPNRTSPRAYLTAQYIQAGRIDEALKELDELIKNNPSQTGAYGTKGLLYEEQGNLTAAKEQYARALEADPNMSELANNLAYILAEEGRDLDAALRWAQTARRNQPDSPSTADTLGWVYYKRGNYVLALDQLRFAVSKRPDHAVFQYHVAMIYLKTNQISEAQNALEKALRSREDFKQRAQAEAALANIKQR